MDSSVVSLNRLYNKQTLNIFCDASIINDNGVFTGCYGVVGVVEDRIIDSMYKLASNTTNNNSEIKGIRGALSMANVWKDRYKYINIFSDSQISVFGLKKYIYKWRYKDGTFYSNSGTPVANQYVFVEAHGQIEELVKHPNCIFSLYHQAGHISNDYNSLKRAANVFARSNNIQGKIDINMIRYISTYNNYVDVTSRNLLRRSNRTVEYCDPIYFEPRGKINN